MAFEYYPEAPASNPQDMSEYTYRELLNLMHAIQIAIEEIEARLAVLEP